MTLPTATPVGSLALAKYYFALTFAACPTVQTLFAAASAAAAQARIWIDGLPPPVDGEGKVQARYTLAQLAALRPHIMIGTGPRQLLISRRIATDTFGEAGYLLAWIEIGIDAELQDDPSALERSFDNTIGQIVNDLKAISYQPGYLAIDEIIVEGIWRCPENAIHDVGDHFLASLNIKWNGGLPL